MDSARDVVALIARILLAIMFVQAGFGKITGFEGTAGYIASKGLPLPQVGTVIAIAVEFGGGLLLIAGWKSRCVALALAVFTVAATYFFHDFWHMADAAARTNQIMFMKNVAVIGGLLMVWVFGPGRLSVDRR